MKEKKSNTEITKNLKIQKICQNEKQKEVCLPPPYIFPSKVAASQGREAVWQAADIRSKPILWLLHEALVDEEGLKHTGLRTRLRRRPLPRVFAC